MCKITKSCVNPWNELSSCWDLNHVKQCQNQNHNCSCDHKYNYNTNAIAAATFFLGRLLLFHGLLGLLHSLPLPFNRASTVFPSCPLILSLMVSASKARLQPLGLAPVSSDQHSSSALIDIAMRHSARVTTSTSPVTLRQCSTGHLFSRFLLTSLFFFLVTPRPHLNSSN